MLMSPAIGNVVSSYLFQGCKNFFVITIDIPEGRFEIKGRWRCCNKPEQRAYGGNDTNAHIFGSIEIVIEVYKIESVLD